MERTIKYGLYSTEHNRILGFEIESNDGGEFCNSTTVTLCSCADNMWLVSTAELAEWTRTHKQRWYNSCMSSPVNPFKPNTLQVFKVTMATEIVQEVKLPDVRDWYELPGAHF